MYELLYEKIADALVRDGFIVVDDALQNNLLEALIADAKEHVAFRQAGISSSASLDSSRRRDQICWLERSASLAQEAYLNFALGLQNYLNATLYLGLKRYEAHFARYGVGDFYEKHFDAFRTSKNRVVTTVFYLNKEWRESDGGCLVVYDKEGTILKELLPKANRLVVFLSEEFAHEVLPAKKERYSIAGWFRVDQPMV
jgi:SM-20-related protein